MKIPHLSLGIISGDVTYSIEEILNRLPDLNIFGFRTDVSDEEHANYRAALLTPDSREIIAWANRWLFPFSTTPLTPAGKRWRHDSYSLKHIFEQESGVYIENGAFIVCALQCGFAIKHESGPNCLIAAYRRARRCPPPNLMLPCQATARVTRCARDVRSSGLFWIGTTDTIQ